MPNERIIADVGELKGMMGGLKDDIQELKGSQEEQWREFRKEQNRANGNEKQIIGLLHRAESERIELRNDVKNFKGECDERFEAGERGKKTKIAMLAVVISGVFNIGAEAVRKWI